MIQRYEKGKLSRSAELWFAYDEEKRIKIRKKAIWDVGDLDKLFEKVEAIQNESKRIEGIVVIDCLTSGKKVVLYKKAIYLFLSDASKPTWTIKGNKELYSLLKDMIKK